MVSGRINRVCLSLLVIASFLVGFTMYCAVLIHWVKTISHWSFADYPIQIIGETAFLLIYTFLGIRFCRKKINFL